MPVVSDESATLMADYVGSTQRVQVAMPESGAVTATIYSCDAKHEHGITLILAHGAGANQSSDFMVRMARAMAARGITAVTFNFPYTEAGRRIPDPAARLEASYNAIVSAARGGLLTDGPAKTLVIGGKSMGGRIATQIAAAPRKDVDGIVALGYPLHPPGRPDKLRTAHLPRITAPMLIVQGERDTFGTPEELRPILETLKSPVELYVVTSGNHSLTVPKRGAPPQAEVDRAVADKIEQWLRSIGDR
jgi:predicted alpha/beta-hydrolase family hydrolase